MDGKSERRSRVHHPILYLLFMEEITVKKLDGNDSKYYCDAFDVSIGDTTNKILTIFTALETTISKWIGDIKKIHRSSNKKNNNNKKSLIIGFCAEREIKHKKGGLEDNPIDILTLCFGSSHCLIVDISSVVGSYIYAHKEYRTSYGFSKSLKDLLTDSNTVLVGLDMETVSTKFEKDFGFKLGRTVDLRSLAEKGLLIELGGEKKQEKELEEERRKVGKYKLDDLLNRVMEPELKIRRPTKKINIYYENGINDDKVLYTTLDGFVAWKIGTKYVDLIKNNA